MNDDFCNVEYIIEVLIQAVMCKGCSGLLMYVHSWINFKFLILLVKEFFSIKSFY